MGKLIFFLLLAVVVYAMLRGALRSRARPPEPGPARKGEPEDFVACARCGVNLPRSEARLEGERFVCHANPHCR